VRDALKRSLVYAARGYIHAGKELDDGLRLCAVHDVERIDADRLVDLASICYPNLIVALSFELAHALHIHVVQMEPVALAGEEQTDDAASDLASTKNRDVFFHG
jgi:hypothetical protein